MNTTSLRQKLHQFIDSIGDEKAEAIYTLFQEEIDTEGQRKKLVLAERQNYLQGEGKSYTWEEVKQMALDKGKRHGI